MSDLSVYLKRLEEKRKQRLPKRYPWRKKSSKSSMTESRKQNSD